MNTKTSGRKMSLFTVSMIIVVATFGFPRVIDNVAQLGLAAIPSWFVVGFLYFLPLALILAEFSSDNTDARGGIYSFMERANEELDRGRRLSIAGYFSVRYIVADQSEIDGWLGTGTVRFERRFGRLVVFENILFKPYAEVNLDSRDRSSPVVESTIYAVLFEEERIILDVFVHREGKFFLTLKESYYSP